ncbi:MAG: AMP-binding protein [Methanobacteriaceae archaeon]
MTTLIENYVNRVDFDSYDDFNENFDFVIPENFNFAYDIVDKYAAIDPNKIALVWCNDEGEERIFTFADMKEYSDRAANFFKSCGINKGDAVMLTLKNRYEFWFSMVALHKIGAMAIPATHMLKEKDITYRIENASIKMVVSVNDPVLIDNYIEAEKCLNESNNNNEYNGFKKAIVGDIDSNYSKLEANGWMDFEKEVENASAKWERPTGEEATKNDDKFLIYFSSGTTGLPKMVLHDFTYPIGHIITAKYWHNVVEDGLHHTSADTGWAKTGWGSIYGQWICGTGIFIYDYDRFNGLNLIQKVEKYKVTTFCAPPTIYRFLIKEDLSSYDFSNITHASTAGEPLNDEVFKQFYDITGLKIYEGFGQSESAILVGNFKYLEPKPGSMGKPSPRTNIELLDENYNIVDIGEKGEITVNIEEGVPPGLFKRYYRDLERTRESWYGSHYHTGDTAWMDEDGYYWFVGRNDDIIKSSGYRIGPFEVESALISHPSVLECAITGVPHDIRGQVVKATIVLAKGYEESDELKKELQDHVKNITAPYKYPRIVEFVDELPKTISGKIIRKDI